MNYEIRVIRDGQTGRIKILPANPRTARGFSGDLILDEFAFHENSTAIWEAAEPILSANRDYLCRVASTPNGRHNMFYRLVTDPTIPKRIVPRSEAWAQGLKIFHPVTRALITPEAARAFAHDKRAYDQNYECIFESENMALLTHELISAAEDPEAGVICDDQWSPEALSLLACDGPSAPEFGGARLPPSRIPSPTSADFHSYNEPGQVCSGENNGSPLDPLECEIHHPSAPENGGARLLPSQTPPQPSALSPRTSPTPRTFYVGVDVGRHHDLTVMTVLEKERDMFFVRAILRLRNLRLPAQQELLEIACRSPRFAGAQIDMTGLGLGLYEYTHKKFGDRIRGLNFASSLPISTSLGPRPSNLELTRARAPEVLALRLLQTYESRRIRHPIDPLLREDLHTPERITSSEGRVSIAAARTESGHADHFWSFALALDAALRQPEPYIHVVHRRRRPPIPTRYLI